MQARVLLLTLLITTPLTAQADDLVVLLQQRNCPDCRLADVDLAHADLRYADLQRAQLQGANLGQARLDGANFKGADLSFTSLRGASLRGADFTGSRLYGTDLREADLSGALFNPKALEEAHWQGVTGVAVGSRSNARLHNAGVKAFQASRWAEAERLFTDAIRSDPNEPLSWVARGISRSEQAKDDLAAADFSYAAASSTRGIQASTCSLGTDNHHPSADGGSTMACQAATQARISHWQARGSRSSSA